LENRLLEYCQQEHCSLKERELLLERKLHWVEQLVEVIEVHHPHLGEVLLGSLSS
jgi:hypothetical protein